MQLVSLLFICSFVCLFVCLFVEELARPVLRHYCNIFGSCESLNQNEEVCLKVLCIF
jgi:hypothetical protein